VLVLSACGGRAATTLDPVPAAVACGGAIGPDAIVLRSDLASGRLHAQGEQLFLVETGGRVLRIDRCTGDAVELTTGLSSVSSSAVTGEHVWVLGANADQARRLVRVPTSGASVDAVAVERSATQLVTDGTTLYFLARPDSSNVEVLSLADPSTEPLPFASIQSSASYGLRLLDASAAGLYFSQDCDCAPSLQWLPHGATGLSLLEGAGPVGVWGNYAVELDVDRLYVGVNTWSGGSGIQRLPLEGGEPEQVVSAGSGWSTELEANMKALCWVQGRPDAPRAVRCNTLSDTTQPPRQMDQVDSSLPISLVVSTDALYWLRPANAGANYELVAAAL